jgi:Retrotransposon gag protein
VATPDPFTGDLAKSEEFINTLCLYFIGKQGLTDEQKITFALSYMKGWTAGQWSKRKVKQYAQLGATSWDTLFADLRHAFSDPDPKGTARHKFGKLKQGTSTADEYVATFKELMDDTGYNDDALVEMFERGLKKLLVDRIYTLSDLLETLDEWMSQALKFDRLHRRREEKHRNAAQSHSTTCSQTFPFAASQPLTDFFPR